MRFAFSDEQLAMRDSAREVLAKHCTPADVRAAWSAQSGALDRRVWDELAAMGALQVLVPAENKGLGLDFVSLVLLLEETGRVALPHPYVETAAVVAPLLMRDDVSDGGMIAAGFAGANVPAAADADALVVDHDDAVRLYQRGEFAVEGVEAVDKGRRLARVTGLDGDGITLTDRPREIEAAFDRGVVGISAQLIGLAQTMLDMTVAYVKERQQFGVAVGSFQAVKHMLADALRDLSFARPVVYRAAWAIAHDGGTAQGSAHVSMAKAMASDAATAVGRAALQCHGAIGYTVEHDLHLYLKRTWALARAWGDPAWHRARVADAIGV